MPTFTPQVFAFEAIDQASVATVAFDCQLQLLVSAHVRRVSRSVHGQALFVPVGRSDSGQVEMPGAPLGLEARRPKLPAGLS